MVSTELKKLSRRELIDIIYQMKKNEQQLQEEIASLQNALEEKRMRLSNVGSIAEASMSITDLFSAAQKTADLYLQEVACIKEDAQNEYNQMIEDAHIIAKKIIENAKKTAEDSLSDLKEQYNVLQDQYNIDSMKWLHLREEIEALTIEKQCITDNTRS